MTRSTSPGSEISDCLSEISCGSFKRRISSHSFRSWPGAHTAISGQFRQKLHQQNERPHFKTSSLPLEPMSPGVVIEQLAALRNARRYFTTGDLADTQANCHDTMCYSRENYKITQRHDHQQGVLSRDLSGEMSPGSIIQTIARRRRNGDFQVSSRDGYQGCMRGEPGVPQLASLADGPIQKATSPKGECEVERRPFPLHPGAVYSLADQRDASSPLPITQQGSSLAKRRDFCLPHLKTKGLIDRIDSD